MTGQNGLQSLRKQSNSLSSKHGVNGGGNSPKSGSGRSTAAVSLSNRTMAIEPVFVHANESTPCASQSMFPASKKRMRCRMRCAPPPRRNHINHVNHLNQVIYVQFVMSPLHATTAKDSLALISLRNSLKQPMKVKFLNSLNIVALLEGFWVLE